MWIKDFMGRQSPVKDISVINEAIQHYENTQLERDTPMKNILQTISAKRQ